MNLLFPVNITENISINGHAFLLKFKRPFDFKPGQILGITAHENITPRLYSIASSSLDEYISILYTLKAEGQLTPILAHLNPDDLIWITGPQGKFVFNNEPAWWIATGTGIAPFYSMFLTNQRPLKLIHGGRKIEDIMFRPDLSLLGDYIICCSQDSGDKIYPGRLTQYLNDFENLPQHINYYICGNAEMVVDVRNLLIAKGINFRQVLTEIYF
ncbi:MAG: FAD-binding oxidoreductase [Salinivirgaceae bacterium]|nr:FAD-binding oxidoreductase [Salinivirgaceae bacterium]